MDSNNNIHAPTVSSGPTSTEPTTSHANNPQTLHQLIVRKESAEAELSALGSVLDSHNVTMTTPLTTADGFPRADLDVAQIRTTRARIIRLRNDYKVLMGRVEEKVLEGFAKGGENGTVMGNGVSHRNGAAAPAEGAAQEGGNVERARNMVAEVPFAKVNAVVEGSPAAVAGMVAGDKVTEFGDADWRNHERLAKVARVVQENENRTVIVKVLRETSADAASRNMELSLTPRRNWGGRGLLGCHLLPL
ncbi:hypothetical protein MBLNU230_g8197t1 [Neophaeotheca triangularis]